MKTFSFKLNKYGIAETNVPEEYFLNIDKCDRFSLSYECNRWHNYNYYGYKINKEDFEKNAKVLYLNADSANTVNYSNKVVFVKLNKSEELAKTCFDEKREYENNILNENWTILFVVEDNEILSNCKADTYKYVYLALPQQERYMSKAKKKVFLSSEDLEENTKQNEQKAKEKKAKIDKKFEETNNGTIKLTTPKFEIIEINKSTDNVPNAKVGDIIYGEMTVLENGKNKFHIASVYVNYVTLYKNGEKLNVLPQSVFGDVMAKNFKLKQLTD